MSDPIINNITISVTGTIDSSMVISLDTSGLVVVDTIPIPPEPTPPPIPAAETLTVELTYQGKVYLFDESIGIDLGDYVEPGGHFVQMCMLTIHPELPGFRVMFRPDANGHREEVVFELGGVFGNPTPFNMLDYTVKIKRGGQEVANIAAPCHYWNARWRWQSAPRPIIYSVDDLMGDILPCYSEELFGDKIPLSVPRTYTKPMDLAGITPYIPSTGERDEIGLFTEAQAEYLCQRTQTAWASVQAQLEASGTIPWHFRDEKTNAPLDVNEYPQATMYGSTGDPLIKNPTSPITLDDSHEGSFAFLSFALTGDPYALEEMQFYTTYNTICVPPNARQNWNLGHAVRAVAWALRALAQNATMTPVEVPSWLMSREYFKTLLDQEREWFMTRWVGSTTPPASNFNIVSDGNGAPASPPIPANGYVSIWMEDFLSAVLGWIVCAGHEDWRPIMNWKAKDIMARTNGISGWVRAVPTLYTMVIRGTSSGPYADDWLEAWQLNEQFQSTKVKYTDANAFPTTLDLTYPSYIMGALALLSAAGAPGADDSYAWILEQMQKNTVINSKYPRRKWAIAPGPVSV